MSSAPRLTPGTANKSPANNTTAMRPMVVPFPFAKTWYTRRPTQFCYSMETWTRRKAGIWPFLPLTTDRRCRLIRASLGTRTMKVLSERLPTVNRVLLVSAAVTAGTLVGAGGGGRTVSADEGMWLLNNPPRQLLRAKYHFDLSDAWLDKVQKASVRFNNGGSGGFVSADGLILTNHHIGADCLQKLS